MPGNEFIKALVVSDSHGNKTALKQIAHAFAEVDYVFHLGDVVSDALYLEREMKSKVLFVRGNCDCSDIDIPEFEEVTLLGQKIILTHGHLLKVKYSYDRLYYYAKEHGAQAMLFGHTHHAYSEYIEGIWYLNPGSCGVEGVERRSVALLLISKNGVVPKILYPYEPQFTF